MKIHDAASARVSGLKRRLLRGAACSLLLPVLFSAYLPASERGRPGWILVWEDQFDGDRLDPSKWRVENAALEKNNELQYYHPEAVRVENGMLCLKSMKKSMGGRNYVSGLVETRGRFQQTFGRFEIRARLPSGRGIWPAHWMMNAAGRWPPEIDIMEMIGHEPDTVHMTNHYGTWPQNRMEGKSFRGPDFSKAFHTFALEWEPESLRWFVDGTLRFSTTRHVPRIPFYLILNTAGGGDWPGPPDETTVFPQEHLIDYVRVYQRDVAGTAPVFVAARNGTVSRKPDAVRYPLGTKVDIEARPRIGYRFAGWGGDAAGRDNPLRVEVSRPLRIRARFEKDADAPRKILRGMSAKASSVERKSLGPENAVDGDPSTRWSSEFSDPQWIRVDLGKTLSVGALRLVWERALGKRYRIEVSPNGVEWRCLKEVEDNRDLVCEYRFAPVSARFLRITGLERATAWGYSLWEIEVFENVSKKPAFPDTGNND
jgi:beta-glucanase (GH16 family)